MERGGEEGGREMGRDKEKKGRRWRNGGMPSNGRDEEKKRGEGWRYEERRRR